MGKAKIVQATPVDGWFAVFWTRTDPFFELRRLLTLAVLEHDGETTIDGVTAGMMLCAGSQV